MAAEAANRAGRLPDFIIVGAQKSGTTSLAHYLGAHPDIYCHPTEIHYFDRFLDRGAAWYRSQFAPGIGRPLAGEGTPEYLYLPEAAAELAELVPNARLIAILRQPVDRAYSQYWHNKTRGAEDLEFTDALAAEGDRIARAASPRDRARFAYLDRGRYATQLRRLTSWFPRERIHIVLSDDLGHDRAATMASTYRFLGADANASPTALAVERNPFIEFRSQRLRPLIRRLPGPARRVAGRLNIRYTRYPPLDAGLRAELTAGFEEELQSLEAFLGRDLTSWRCA